MEQAAQDFAQTYVALLGWSWSWWSSGGDPDISQVGEFAAAVRPVTRWATAALLALGLVGAGVTLAVRRRGSDLADVVLGVSRALLVVSAGWLILASAWSLGDRMGRWIVGRSAGVGAYRDSVAEAATKADPVVALMLSIVGVACCLAFACVLLGRVVLVVVLVAGMPVLAAGSILSGRTLRMAGAWAVAVVAFDPLAALVYRVGHGLAVRAEQPVVVLLVACVTSFMAAGMLPLTARVAGAVR
jgi:hypothetical protein